MRTFIPAVGHPLEPPRTVQESPAARAARRERAKFYGLARWSRLSRWWLANHPTCVWCGHLAEMVDHKHPRLTRPDLAFEHTNLRSCCRRCHAEHAKKAGD
jgi:5-methylcytosine-specific restriction endonuclease McrA